MNVPNIGNIAAAEVDLPCSELGATLDFFTGRLGFRLVAIFPADDPATAVVVGHGLRLRLRRGETGSPGRLRLLCREPVAAAGGSARDPITGNGGIATLTAPNGTVIEFAEADPPILLPPLKPSIVIRQSDREPQWHVGRAGMEYRDLVPDRQGGRFIASHIRIERGGPVPDYVHFHKIRFQMIFCVRGWVRLVYEDQGPPFVMRAGDCVLQPPRIRHRVLECSDGFEVVEIASPAAHETCADPDLALPTPHLRPDRDFGGQRFVFDQAIHGAWKPWRIAGFEHRETAIGIATKGLGCVRALRATSPAGSSPTVSDNEFLFRFILNGAMTIAVDGHGANALRSGDSFVIPAGVRHSFADCSRDLEWLEVGVGERSSMPAYGV